MLATRDELLGTFQRRYREVPLPSGRTVRIQNVTELERCRIEARRLNAVTDAERRKAAQEDPCRWIIATVVDSAGQRLFREEDLPALQQLDSSDTRAIYIAAQEHCLLPVTTAEEHEKNCDGTNDGCSS